MLFQQVAFRLLVNQCPPSVWTVYLVSTSAAEHMTQSSSRARCPVSVQVVIPKVSIAPERSSLDRIVYWLSAILYMGTCNSTLTEVQAAPLFQQIVRLVRDAHSRGIALRDINLKNWVFENKSKTQLSLYYAKLMDHSGQFTDQCGCPVYACPEMLQPRAADLWSLGVLLYTLLVGRYPFFDISIENLFFKIRKGHYQIPNHVSVLAQSLISSLLVHNPNDRATAWALLEHPWFKHAADMSRSTTLNKDQNCSQLTIIMYSSYCFHVLTSSFGSLCWGCGVEVEGGTPPP